MSFLTKIFDNIFGKGILDPKTNLADTTEKPMSFQDDTAKPESEKTEKQEADSEEETKDDQVVHSNPYYRKLYLFLNRISTVIFIIGLLAFIYIFIIQQELFHALAIFLAFSWATIFIRYFTWATYFYNINYGWTDADWDKYFDALERKKNGEYVLPEELNAPKFNVYRSQSFGLPNGTVRGMIALTLLFGGLSLMISSFGKDGNVATDSFYWDHFEFFKTAFLMMIAFYFGDKSLKYLQNRSNAAREEAYYRHKSDDKKSTEMPSRLEQDEFDFRYENDLLDKTVVGRRDGSASEAASFPVTLTSNKKAIAQSEAPPQPAGLIPIIDAGHGGMKGSKYMTEVEGKFYQFEKVPGLTSFTIYEGEINRKIGQKLAHLLEKSGIPYLHQTLDTYRDLSLPDRVRFANENYASNPKLYFLSIHSNAAGVGLSGTGSRAKGFEIYTSRGQTKSDELADIFARQYKHEFPDFRFRQETVDGDLDKESNFYVLSQTVCPAILVENLFFDNREEAMFLMSESGQWRIATCMFNAVRKIHETQNLGILA